MNTRCTLRNSALVNHMESYCRSAAVCVCVCVCAVYLCENLNSVSCFLPFCFPLLHRRSEKLWAPYCFYYLCLLAYSLSLSLSLPLCPILCLFFLFFPPVSLLSSFLFAPCWFVLSSNFHRLTRERAEADKTLSLRLKRSRG